MIFLFSFSILYMMRHSDREVDRTPRGNCPSRYGTSTQKHVQLVRKNGKHGNAVRLIL